jgi:ankyrin repeat protein
MNIHAVQDQHALIEYLKQHPDEIMCVDDDENSILQIYSANKFKDIQDYVIEACPEIVYSENSVGRNALFDAIDSANARLVRKILEVFPDALWEMDDNGITPIYHELQYDNNHGVFEAMLPFVDIEDVGADALWELLREALSSYKKAVLMLQTFPELYDYREDGQSILAIVARNCFSYGQALVKFICSERPELLLVADDDGMVPAHVAITYDMLDLMFRLCPECLTVRDRDGNTPLHYTKVFTKPASLDNILKSKRDVLTIRDNAGRTLPMILVMTNSVPGNTLLKMFEANERCFAVEDHRGSTVVHYAAVYKRVGWGKLSGKIVKAFPELVSKKDVRGNTPVDDALSDSGDIRSAEEREAFFAACAEVSDIPDKAWGTFRCPSRQIESSFGRILKRSEATAAKAFKFLSVENKERVRALLLCWKSLSTDVVINLVAKLT